jgi:hypothetical protein
MLKLKEYAALVNITPPTPSYLKRGNECSSP